MNDIQIDRLLSALELIADSLKVIADKPPVGVTLELTDEKMSEFDAREALK